MILCRWRPAVVSPSGASRGRNRNICTLTLQFIDRIPRLLNEKRPSLPDLGSGFYKSNLVGNRYLWLSAVFSYVTLCYIMHTFETPIYHYDIISLWRCKSFHHRDRVLKAVGKCIVFLLHSHYLDFCTSAITDYIE